MYLDVLSIKRKKMEKKYRKTKSGLFMPESPFSLVVPKSEKTHKTHPTAFDFFAGCGGFSLGLIQAGFEVVGACEFWEDAAHTYMYNLGAMPIHIEYTSDTYKEKLKNYFDKDYKSWIKQNKNNPLAQYGISGGGWIKSEREQGNIYPPVKNFFFGDIREMTGKELSSVIGVPVGGLDLVVGGPPCQGFSKAGKQDENDPRNILVFEYARMISELNPKTFVMEEVPEILNMRTSKGVPVIDQFLRILEDGNYMSYEAGMKALNIREEQIGKKPKYVVRPNPNVNRQNKASKKAENQNLVQGSLF